MRGRRAIRAGLVVLAVAAPAVALAATQRDRDDSRGAVDLSSVKAAHNRVSDEIVYVMRFHDPVTPDMLVNGDGPPGSICVNVWTTRRYGEAPPNHEACITSGSSGTGLQASVARHGTTGSVRRSGPASVTQVSSRRIDLRIDPDRIRRPKRFRWTVQATAFSRGCPKTTGCEDYVPDRPKSSVTRLGKPRNP